MTVAMQIAAICLAAPMIGLHSSISILLADDRGGTALYAYGCRIATAPALWRRARYRFTVRAAPSCRPAGGEPHWWGRGAPAVQERYSTFLTYRTSQDREEFRVGRRRRRTRDCR